MSKRKRRLYLCVTAFIMSICLCINNSIFVLAEIVTQYPIQEDKPDLTLPTTEDIKIETFSYEQPQLIVEVVPEYIPMEPKKYSDVLPEVEVIIPEFSDEDIALIARVTMSEASTQSFEVQVAVAQTVINRVHSGNFGNTVSDVIYSENQFSTADNGTPNEQVMAAVNAAITNPPYPYDMYYFRQYHYHTWAKDYMKLGVLYFSLEP